MDPLPLGTEGLLLPGDQLLERFWIVDKLRPDLAVEIRTNK